MKTRWVGFRSIAAYVGSQNLSNKICTRHAAIIFISSKCLLNVIICNLLEQDPSADNPVGKINIEQTIVALQGNLSAVVASNALTVDVAKQLIAVATGANVLLAAFHDKLWGIPLQLRWMIASAVISLIFCVVFSLKICALAINQGAIIAHV